MAEWADAMLRQRCGSDGLLNAYGRCLRLVSGLASGPGMTWVTGRVTACLNPDRVRNLSADPLVALVRQRIREADDLDRALLRFLCTVGESDEVSPVSGVSGALTAFSPVQNPWESLRSVMQAEQRISDIWIEALEMPELPRFDIDLRQQAPLETEQIRTLVGGRLFGHLFGNEGLKRRKWDSDSLRGESVQGIPLWCADLLPPQHSVVQVVPDPAMVPLAVVHGCVQDMPKWITPWVVGVDRQRELMVGSVMRCLPSGTCTWELDGSEISMPTSGQVYSMPPSMLANTVCHNEVEILSGEVGLFESKGISVAWPNTVTSANPWLHFRSLLLSEVAAFEFDQQVKESGDADIGGHKSSKSRRKRKGKHLEQEDGEGKHRRVGGKGIGEGASPSGGDGHSHSGLDHAAEDRRTFTWRTHDSQNVVQLHAKSRAGPKDRQSHEPPSGSGEMHGEEGRGRGRDGDNVEAMWDARSRGRGPDRETGSARPKSPSLSPMPHPRMAISPSARYFGA